MTSSRMRPSKGQSQRSAAPSDAPDIFTAAPAIPWKPHGYQKRAVKFLLEHAAAALLQDPGLGKTSETLAAIKVLRDKGMVEKVLLVAPKRVAQSTWPRELKKWEDFSDIHAVVLHGDHKEEVLLGLPADVYIINPDGLPWLLGVSKTKTPSGKTRVKVDLARWRKLGFDMLVVDELSKFKDSSTQRFKMMREIVPTFGRRWGLTGSPAPNGLIDLFGQMYVIDEGRSLGRYVTGYRMRYFTPSWDGHSWDLQQGAEKEIYKRIKPIALTMAAEDYIKMPRLIENEIRVELPPEARRVYDQLEDHLFAQIRDKVVVASNAAVSSMKCRQVANGGVYVDDHVAKLIKVKRGRTREHVDLHDQKVEAVADLVDELQGEPLLVAYDFEHDLSRLRARLGQKVPHIGGGTTAKEANRLESMWNEGKLPVLLGHPQSLAHGLNLQGAGRHVCFHSLTWNFELYDQFIRRVWRQGQKASRVFVHLIVAEDTVDETVMKALRAKAKGQKALFDALRERASLRGVADFKRGMG